ncbi:unnamed protein product [Coffea canephora]|uniref:DH200=94 genomic scaffold, scaffold_545 n=1 Tax=Coffea canephora TaxID=49390 RepID=A0A068VG17_COFCA|nr:unnamed protein product [Coffea canephora]
MVNGEELKFNLVNKDGSIEPIALVSNMPRNERTNQEMNEEVKSINFFGTNFYGIGAREARLRTEIDLISSAFHESIREKSSQLEKGEQMLLQGAVEPLHDKSNTPPWHLRKLDDGDKCMAHHTVEWLGSFDPWEENHFPMS